MPETGEDTESARTGIEQRLTALEQRVRLLEDREEITNLVLSYGPLVDSGRAEDVAGLWENEGVYDVDELAMSGRERIERMVRSKGHQSWINGGCAHLLGAPHVTVNGEHASVVCYSLMVVHDHSAGFVLRRATANHWQLRRHSDGWRVAIRTSRVLDGRDSARELLGSIDVTDC